MDLSVVIVSWNCREELRGCLAALRDEPPSGAWELFVVDNASADDTAEMVRREFPQVRLIANEDNRGFAAANNQALQEATGDCLLLLNPDTQPEAGAIDILIRFLHEHPGVGVVGPNGRHDQDVGAIAGGPGHVRVLELPERPEPVLPGVKRGVYQFSVGVSDDCPS